MKKLTTLALAGAFVLGLSGCANMERDTAGAVGGSAAGALVGTVLGGPVATIIGAGAGAFLGDQYVDENRATR